MKSISDISGWKRIMRPLNTITYLVSFVVLVHGNLPPRFPSDHYSFRVKEDVEPGVIIDNITASDADSGINGLLDYSLSSSDDALNKFAIHSTTASLTVNDFLNREENDVYRLTVTVRDGAGDEDRATIIIKVLDVNDHDPQFPTSRYSFSVRENSRVGLKVADLQASDPDEGSNGDIRYRLLENPYGLFHVFEKTGSLTVSEKIDSDPEQISRVTLVLEASDNGTPQRSTTVDVDIEIVDEADTPPEFGASKYTIQALENLEPGSLIIDLNATTPDRDVTIEYWFEGSSGPFSMNRNTGEILLSDPLDYETQTFYLLLAAAGGRKPQELTSSVKSIVSIIVEIVNVNDDRPEFSRAFFHFTIPEARPILYQVHQLEAADSDKGVFGELTYFVKDGSLNLPFKVKNDSGIILTTRVLNYERTEDRNGFVFTLVAVDGGKPAFSSSTTVQIKVSDVNEPPSFSQPLYTGSVSEDADTDTTVMRVEAMDPDIERTETLITYKLRSYGNFLNAFRIDESSGVIFTQNALDRETYDEYNLIVEAVDDVQTNLFSTASVRITIGDINDNSPKFLEAQYDYQVLESIRSPYIISQIEAEDKDFGSNSELIYSSNNLPVEFSLDRNLGYLVLRDGQSLDFERRKSYAFDVDVSDKGDSPKLTSTRVTVIVNDVNDNPPIISNPPTEVSVRENLQADTIVFSLVASDEDEGQNGIIKEFLIIGNNFAVQDFRIDNSGVFKTRKRLDRETIDRYQVIIRVVDAGVPSLSSDITVTVVVDDVIDTPPQFIKFIYDTIIAEFKPKGSPIVEVRAKSFDDLKDNKISYSLDGGSSKYGIQSNTGTVVALVDIDPDTMSGEDIKLTVGAHVRNLSNEVSFTISIRKSFCSPLSTSTTVYFSHQEAILHANLLFLHRLRGHSVKCDTRLTLNSTLSSVKNLILSDEEGNLFASPNLPTVTFNADLILTNEDDVTESKLSINSINIDTASIENSVYLYFPHFLASQVVSRQLDHLLLVIANILECNIHQIQIIAVQDDTLRRGTEVLISVRQTSFGDYYLPHLVVYQLKRNLSFLKAKLSIEPTVIGFDSCSRDSCQGLEECKNNIIFSKLLYYTSPNAVFVGHAFRIVPKCFCPKGFERGSLCMKSASICSSSTCKFGGTCVPTKDGYKCVCPPSTTGPDCGTVCDLTTCNPCHSNPCVNGGLCRPTSSAPLYKCICPHPNMGPNCEVTTVTLTPDSRLAIKDLGSLNSISLSLEFASADPNGLILHSGAVGSQYLALELENGQVKLVLSDLRVSPLKTSSTVLLNDGKRHQINVTSANKMIYLTVTGCQEDGPLLLYNGNIAGSCQLVQPLHSIIHLNGLLFLGSIDAFLKGSHVSSGEYTGCISHLTLNDRLVDLNDSSEVIISEGVSSTRGCSYLELKCSGVTCPNGRCENMWNGSLCVCQTAEECTEVYGQTMTFSGNGLSVNVVRQEVSSVRMAFRTSQQSAVIANFNEQAFLTVQYGTVEWINGLVALRAPAVVNDGLWHEVVVTWSGSRVRLSVDNGRVSVQRTRSGLFLVNNLTLASSSHQAVPAFHGCIGGVQIGERSFNRIPLSSTVQDGCNPPNSCQNSECPLGSICRPDFFSSACTCPAGVFSKEGLCRNPCKPNPCSNGGICTTNKGEFQCQCNSYHSGSTCDNQVCPSFSHFQLFGMCRPCMCDLAGSTDLLCNGTSKCQCNPRIPTFSPPNQLQCQPCSCNPYGSVHSTCNKITGECECIANVVGSKCDSCQSGYYGLDRFGCKAATFVNGVIVMNYTITSKNMESSLNFFKQKIRSRFYSIPVDYQFDLSSLTLTQPTVMSFTAVGFYQDTSQPPPRLYQVREATIASLQRLIGIHGFDSFGFVGSCEGDTCAPGETCTLKATLLSCDECLGIYSKACRALTTSEQDSDFDGIQDSQENPNVFNPHGESFSTDNLCISDGMYSITWSPTLKGSQDVKACPRFHQGFISRVCGDNGWQFPDSTDCRSPVSVHLDEIVQEIMTKGLLQDTLSVNMSLESTISLLSMDQNVLSGDLLSISNYLIETIEAEIDLASKGLPRFWTGELLTSFLKVYNNIWDVNKSDLWALQGNIATQSLQSFSHILQIAGSLPSEISSASFQNIGVLLSSIISSTDTFSLGTADGHSTAEINLPEELKGSSVSMGIVSSISGHLNPVSGQRIINSHVLLVETELSVNITQFNSPLKFKLQWSNEVLNPEVADPECVFLKDDLTWSGDGCKFEMFSSDRQGAVCQCYHLSIFGVAVNAESLNHRLYPVHIVTYVFEALGILVLIPILIAVIYYRVGGEGYLLNAILFVSLGLTQLLFVTGINIAAHGVIACTVMSILQQLTIFMVFVCFIIEAGLIHIFVAKSFHHWSQLPFYFPAIGLSVPILIVGVGVGVMVLNAGDLAQVIGFPTHCFLHTHGYIWGFLIPAIIIMLITTLIYSIGLCKFKKSTETGVHFKNAKFILRILVPVYLLFLLSWILKIVSLIRQLDSKILYGCQIISAILDLLLDVVLLVYFMYGAHSNRQKIKKFDITPREKPEGKSASMLRNEQPPKNYADGDPGLEGHSDGNSNNVRTVQLPREVIGHSVSSWYSFPTPSPLSPIAVVEGRQDTPEEAYIHDVDDWSSTTDSRSVTPQNLEMYTSNTDHVHSSQGPHPTSRVRFIDDINTASEREFVGSHVSASAVSSTLHSQFSNHTGSQVSNYNRSQVSNNSQVRSIYSGGNKQSYSSQRPSYKRTHSDGSFPAPRSYGYSAREESGTSSIALKYVSSGPTASSVSRNSSSGVTQSSQHGQLVGLVPIKTEDKCRSLNLHPSGNHLNYRFKSSSLPRQIKRIPSDIDSEIESAVSYV